MSTNLIRRAEAGTTESAWVRFTGSSTIAGPPSPGAFRIGMAGRKPPGTVQKTPSHRFRSCAGRRETAPSFPS